MVRELSYAPVYVVYGFYETTQGDEIEHKSLGAFEDYEKAMNFGIDLIKKFKVSDYEIRALSVH